MTQKRERINRAAQNWSSSVDAARTDILQIVSRQSDTFAFCVICKTEMPGKRRGAKTCSTACRSVLKREREVVEVTLTNLLHCIGDLQLLIDSPDSVRSQRARVALRQARAELLAACKESGVL